MSGAVSINETWACIESQPTDLRGLPDSYRALLIISAVNIDGRWAVTSRYSDDIWIIEGFTTNTMDSRKKLNFERVPTTYRSLMKALIYRYMHRGKPRRPRGSTIQKFFTCAQPFLQHLENLDIKSFRHVSPEICKNYITLCREIRQTRRSKGKPLSQVALSARLEVVETLYNLSQFTDDPIPQHPWPDSSYNAIAGLTGSDSIRDRVIKTKLIPDDIYCRLFQESNKILQQGQNLLDLRDRLDAIALKCKGRKTHYIYIQKTNYLKSINYDGNLSSFNRSVSRLRTACYVILAITSGCRNHELVYLETGAHHRTEDDEGTQYHWMRSRSEKTDAGVRDWMIPDVAVQALQLMERWAKPYQEMLVEEISQRRVKNILDAEIPKLQKIRHALFLGRGDGKSVRALSCPAWGALLKTFTMELDLKWNLSTHQFRRKFANYVAHSQLGDLRYLREHFAHWSMDMTLHYAMDQEWGKHLDIELYDDIYAEIEDIKLSIVDGWLGETTLAGGYGQSIKHWRRDPENLAIFKSHSQMVEMIAKSTAIRSNGHAWCTADEHHCIGNSLERTSCSECTNAVIGHGHTQIYQKLYQNLRELLDLKDIGIAGRERVLRDLDRCRLVLKQLGYDPEGTARE